MNEAKLSFSLGPSGSSLQLLDGRGRATEIHPLWLRERSRAEDAIDLNNHQRLFDPLSLDEDLGYQKLALNDRDGSLEVRFTDGHQAVFRLGDLLPADPVASLERRAWDASLSPLPITPFAKLKKDDKAMQQWLTDFLELGFCLVSDVPSTERVLDDFVALFGASLRVTNFGSTFEVVTEPNPYDLAYTRLGLTAHSDNPYRCHAPDVQLLYVVRNEADGGESTLVDGLKLAEDLRSEDPDAFNSLTTTDLEFRFEGKDAELVYSVPALQYDAKGRFKQVRFSDRLQFMPLADAAEFSRFHHACRKFSQLAASSRYELEFRMPRGMLMMMDNRRLLHGRKSFAENGHRYLRGAYIDADYIESALRVLARGQGRTW